MLTDKSGLAESLLIVKDIMWKFPHYDPRTSGFHFSLMSHKLSKHVAPAKNLHVIQQQHGMTVYAAARAKLILKLAS